jgi:hypothetical protein
MRVNKGEKMREGVVEFPIFSPFTLLPSQTYTETSVFSHVSVKFGEKIEVCFSHVPNWGGGMKVVVFEYRRD